MRRVERLLYKRFGKRRVTKFMCGFRTGIQMMYCVFALACIIAPAVKTISDCPPEQFEQNVDTIVHAFTGNTVVFAEDGEDSLVMGGYYYGNGTILTSDGNAWEVKFDKHHEPEYMAPIYVTFNTHGNYSEVESWDITRVSDRHMTERK